MSTSFTSCMVQIISIWNILHWTMPYASLTYNNPDDLWLQFFILSNSFSCCWYLHHHLRVQRRKPVWDFNLYSIKLNVFDELGMKWQKWDIVLVAVLSPVLYHFCKLLHFLKIRNFSCVCLYYTLMEFDPVTISITNYS
jgi:hypothetical protein